MSNNTVDSFIVLRTVDNEPLINGPDVVDALETEDLTVNSLNTNTIVSLDDDLTLARFDDPMVCFRIGQQRAEINCQLDFKEMGATEYWTMNVSGDDLQITSSQQVTGIPTMAFTQTPGGTTTATSISNPLRTDTVNPGTWNWTRNANSMVVSHVEFNPADETLRRTFQFGFKGDETDGTYVMNINEHDASGDKIGEYMRTEYTRAKEFKILSDTTNLIANFTFTGSLIASPLQYTGSTPGNGFCLVSDASGNASWETLRLADAYWLGNASNTVLTPAGTPIKAVVGSGTTLNANSLGSWDLNAVQNRLRYTGTRGGTAKCSITVSLTGSNNKTFQLFIYKNGTAVPGGAVQFSTSSTASTASSSIHALTSFVTNDYIELWVSCVGSTDTVQVIQTTMECEIVG